jgi:O-antigen/teichoic acid export membrane protein
MTLESDGATGKSGLSKTAAEDVQTLAKGGAVQIAGQITTRAVAMVFTFVMAAVLSVTGYGLYRKVAQILSIAGQLGLAGFNYAAMRFISKARVAGDHGGVRGSARIGLTGATLSSLLVVAGLVLWADPIADLFSGPKADPVELARLIKVGSPLVLLFSVLQVYRLCTQAYKTMVPSVIAGNIVQPVLRFALGVGVLLLGSGVYAVVVTEVASYGLAAIVAAYFFQRMLTPQEKAATPKAKAGPMIRFALPQGGSSLLGIQSLGLGILILSLYRGDAEVGLFGIALALQGPGGIFLGGIVNIWAPVVSDLYDKGEIDRLGSLYQTITRWVSTFSFPVFAALMLEPDLFLSPFPKEAIRAASAVVILAAGNVFYTGTGPSGYVLSMSGRPGVNFFNSLVGVGLYIGLGIWVVPEHGLVGMAVVDASVTAFVNMARIVEVNHFIGIHPFGRSVLKPIGATLLGALALLAWRAVPGDSVPIELAGVLIAGVVYVAALKKMGLDAEERYVWKRIRSKAFKGRGGKKAAP